ncbi:MAG: transporter substrate-binding domain-containing protein [Bacteroidaceae bacterium]|nr:transporter substrate-binding domain-containing protein [Bacteroidaceae bacterium]
MNKIAKIFFTAICLLLPFGGAEDGMMLHAQHAHESDHTLVIASDWDKPPYEFRNDMGNPAGFYVDVLTTILDELEIPYRFQMLEASKAIDLFEQGKADLIFDNVRKYNSPQFFHTSNIISYYRISVATRKDSANIIPLKVLDNPEEAVFYHGGYAAQFFKHEIPNHHTINYQAPKEALAGIVKGRYKYFVWNEAALQWKIKELNLADDITLHEVNIPVGEIHLIGRDQRLIEAIDDHFSRLKQSGKIEEMYDKWFHPENSHDDTSPIAIFITVGIMVLVVIIYLFVRLAKAHVQLITRNSTETNQMMYKALHMGNFHVMQYDIATNLMTNRHGNILPDGGITLEEFTARIHPNEQEEFKEKMKLLLGGRERKFELEKQWNAGTEEAPKWLRFHGHAIVELDSEGHPQYIVNAIHDITHNIEEEKASHDLQRRFDSLFNTSNIAISFYDRDGWLIMLNDKMKELCGFSNPDNERFWRTMNMHDVPLFRDAYPPDSTHNLEVCQVMDYPELGIKNYIEFQVRPIRNQDGDIPQYLCTTFNLNEDHKIYADTTRLTQQLTKNHQEIEQLEHRLRLLLGESRTYITNLVETQEHLRKTTEIANDSIRLKSAFLASMTHELRTPLNAIVGFATVLKATEDPEERKEIISIINSSCDMLQRLINDILEASSITKNLPTTIQPEDIDFVHAFENICFMLEHRIKQAGLEFIKENPYENFHTTIDIGRVQQIVTNFVTNAVKFTQQGHVRLGYRYEQHGLYIYCEDTGVGIPKDKQEVIFGRFIKLDEFVQGTGMGLNICKTLTERMGGKIGVKSEGDGTGSTFWIWLPCERRLQKDDEAKNGTKVLVTAD